MLSRVGAVMTARLANATVVPLDPRQYAADIRLHLGEIHRRAGELGVALDLSAMDAAVGRLERTAMRVVQRVHVGLERNRLSKVQLQRLDTTMRELERTWVRADGLADRPWYRSFYAATDPDSGYGAWMLPDLRSAVESGDAERVQTSIERYTRIISELTRNLADLSPTGD